MSKQKKLQPTSREFSETEISEIIKGLFEFLHEKANNIFVDDFLVLEKKMLKSDIEALIFNSSIFKEGFENAKYIETTKLKKYAAADRLNATFVKSILPNNY